MTGCMVCHDPVEDELLSMLLGLAFACQVIQVARLCAHRVYLLGVYLQGSWYLIHPLRGSKAANVFH